MDELDEVLEEARALGFLGPSAISDQRRHAEGFLPLLADEAVERAVDLGSGGGLPGLVLAGRLPTTHWVLLDAHGRRTSFLEAAVRHLGLGDRVTVVTERAEEAGRRPDLREMADAVVARGFGSPPVTAECGAALLRPDGVLIVSEPPGAPTDRWPEKSLEPLGLTVDTATGGPPAFVRLRRTGPLSARYPRRTGVPTKRPLW